MRSRNTHEMKKKIMEEVSNFNFTVALVCSCNDTMQPSCTISMFGLSGLQRISSIEYLHLNCWETVALLSTCNGLSLWCDSIAVFIHISNYHFLLKMPGIFEQFIATTYQRVTWNTNYTLQFWYEMIFDIQSNYMQILHLHLNIGPHLINSN